MVVWFHAGFFGGLLTTTNDAPLVTSGAAGVDIFSHLAAL
jgi:hypothetical protein